MAKTYFRKNYLVKKGLQIKLAALLGGVLVIVMLMSGFVVYMTMWCSVVDTFSGFRVSQQLEAVKMRLASSQTIQEKPNFLAIVKEAIFLSEQQRQELKDMLDAVNRKLLSGMSVIIFIIFIGGIFVWHKIAGPLYKIEKSAEKIQHGDLTANFKVRKTDEMQETALLLSKMAESLRSDVAKVKYAAAGLEDKLKPMLGRMSKEEVDAIKTYLDDISGTLSKYKI